MIYSTSFIETDKQMSTMMGNSKKAPDLLPLHRVTWAAHDDLLHLIRSGEHVTIIQHVNAKEDNYSNYK